MKKNIRWLNAITILSIAVYLIDLNVNWYRNLAKNIPIVKYTIIGLSVILFLSMVQILIGNRNSKK